MDADLLEFLKLNLEQIKNKWRENLKLNMPELFADSLQEEITELIINKTIRITKRYFETLDISEVIENLMSFDKPAHQLTRLVEEFNTSMYDVIVEKENISAEELVQVLLRLRHVEQKFFNAITKGYDDEYKKMIALQKASLQELSTPIIPVFDGIMIVPIVGVVDKERAQQMIEKLLNAVVTNKTEIILMDITGVDVVDTEVAYHLIQFVNAIHIVGAKSMLVGIKPTVAQTLVNLGVDLSSVVTFGDLQDGIEQALKLTNRKISEV